MTLAHDLKYSLRLSWRNRMFTAAVIVTLSLCVGANTAILAIVDAALVRPLPYPQPERLAQVISIWERQGASGLRSSHTGMTWELVRDRATMVDAVVYSGWPIGVNLAAADSAAYVKQQRLGAGFFRVLGVAPALGREFTAEEDREGGPPAAILSYHVWQRSFNGDRAIVGRRITLRGEPYTVVGVMPRGMRLNVEADVWTPLKPNLRGEGSGTNYQIMARVKNGVSWEQAQAQLSAVGIQLAEEQKVPQEARAKLGIVSLQRGMTEELRRPLMLLWAAVAAVMLVGCVNIGGMLLSKSAGRTGEMATRLALGAGRWKIARQVLMESLVPALLGGSAGIALGYATLAGLQEMAAKMFPYLRLASLDWRVLTTMLALVIFSALAFSLFPALALMRVDLRPVQGSRGVAGRRRFISLGVIATVQVALTVPLLIGAGVLGRTFLHLWNLNPGFDSRGLLTASFSLQDARYDTRDRVNRLFRDGIARLREQPGIEAATVALSLPYERGLNFPVRFAGEQKRQPGISNYVYVTPEYFRVMRIPLLRGRLFTEGDAARTDGIVIVNEAFARQYLKDSDALTESIVNLKSRIVGVVGNVQQKPGWGDYGPMAPVPTVYALSTQGNDGFFRMAHTWFSPKWIVRSPLPSADVARTMERVIRSVDPMLPIAEFHELDEVKMETLGLQRLLATLLGCLSALALVLSALGIYGLIANSVAERTREFGIRMALGSTVARAMRDAGRPGLLWAAMGIGVGWLLARWSEQLLGRFVWGVSATDVATFAGVGALFLAVAAAASLVPALRLVRLNPARTLREE